MTQILYNRIEAYMRGCMDDSAHDMEHVYRVLYGALRIAQGEAGVDRDVLIAACLLHDVGRREQFADPTLCHAQVGAAKAAVFLGELGCGPEFTERVSHCIRTHRFRKNDPPRTIEAMILFDADKLDVTGAMGIARSLMYRGEVVEPLYSVRPDGTISDGDGDDEPSFFREYKFKLEKLYDRFYTATGTALARERQETARAFYEALYHEAAEGRMIGRGLLEGSLK